MSNLRESLKRLGWEDRLINHYIGKDYKITISSCSSFVSEPTQVDSQDIYIDNNRQYVSKKIVI